MRVFTRRRRREGSGGGAAFVTITDAFTRADSAVSLGSTEGTNVKAWSALSGTWGISTNAAYNPSATADGAAVIDASATDVTVTLSLAAGGTAGICFRATDASNYYRACRFGTDLQLQKRVAGVNTSLVADFPYTPVANDVLVVIASGSSLTVKVNGVTRLTATDSTYLTQTKHGICCSTGDAALRWDNFSVSSP